MFRFYAAQALLRARRAFGIAALPAGIAIIGLALFLGPDEQVAAKGRTELHVFAASSLTEGFMDIARAFEAEHPDVDVKLSFAGSQVLRLQIEQGAPAAVFASANHAHMQRLVDSELVATHSAFARNRLTVVVPRDNPAGIASFGDLSHARRVVVGNTSVPVGVYANEVFERARGVHGEAFVQAVQAHVVSRENNVRIVRAKVELGEADAAIVYETDARASDKVRAVAIPEALNAAATYRIGVVGREERNDAAERFVAFVRSATGQDVLAKRGFVVGAD